MGWMASGSLVMVLLFATLACAPGGGSGASIAPQAQAPAADTIARTPEQLYQQMLGKSRDEQLAILERGARQEGKLDLYTSGDEDRVRAWVDAFKQAYPYLEVKFTRGSTRQLTERFITQARAGQPQGDLFHAGVETLEIIHAEGLAAQHVIPDRERVPPELRPDHHYWSLDRLLSHHAVFNKNLTAADQLPDSFEGFTAPEWRGKFAVNSDGKEWFACMAKARGRDAAAQLMRSLMANQPVVLEGKTVLLERMVLGDFLANIDNTGSTAYDMMKTGAPVAFKTLNPICVNASGGLVAQHAQNPHAAVLYLNYNTSAEMQRLFAQQGYMPLSRDVEPVDPAMRPAGAQMVLLTEQDLEPQKYKELVNLHTEIVVRRR